MPRMNLLSITYLFVSCHLHKPMYISLYTNAWCILLSSPGCPASSRKIGTFDISSSKSRIRQTQHKQSPWLSGRQCIPWRHLQAVFIRDGDVVSISSSCTVLYLAMYSISMWVRELLVSWVYQISFAFSSRPKLYVIIFHSKIGRPAEEMEVNQDLELILFPQVPNLYLSERKRVLSSKMMNPWPQNIQKRDTGVLLKVKNKYKLQPNLKSFNLMKKCQLQKLISSAITLISI